MITPWASLFIRPAVASDLMRLAEIARDAPLPGWGLAPLSEELERPRTLVLVLADGPTILGFAAISWVLDEASLHAIAVAPEAQRRGLGRRLLEAAEAAAIEAGAAVMHLEVRASSGGAREFYSAQGYRPTGLRRGYYADGVDALLLSRALN